MDDMEVRYGMKISKKKPRVSARLKANLIGLEPLLKIASRL